VAFLIATLISTLAHRRRLNSFSHCRTLASCSRSRRSHLGSSAGGRQMDVVAPAAQVLWLDLPKPFANSSPKLQACSLAGVPIVVAVGQIGNSPVILIDLLGAIRLGRVWRR